MKEYAVVNADELALLEQFMDEWIKEGWEPQGGIFYAEGMFLQAVIREIPDDN